MLQRLLQRPPQILKEAKKFIDKLTKQKTKGSQESNSASPPQEEKKIKIQPFEKKSKGKVSVQGSLFGANDLPPLTLLNRQVGEPVTGYSAEKLEEMSRLLEQKLKDFGVKIEVVAVNPGPVITRFEIQPAPGVKASKITNLAPRLGAFNGHGECTSCRGDSRKVCYGARNPQ